MNIKSIQLVTFVLFTALSSLAFAGGEFCNSKAHKETSADASDVNGGKNILSERLTENMSPVQIKSIDANVTSDLINS